ncbi:MULTISPECIES: lysozyme [Brenneria]|uniref:Lysozyme n=1 Tax=Brenneria nigrifluens DSM 30175 = ATCC 13028 TaxID=1121120 RepID=A0A2U1UUN7_9GAMM|nr:MULTISPECIES: lysozyme [Brenneria]EHD22064.1 glycoside hydrolase family 24 [Brenneria sp. EniD312]PWC25394.1 glycoside hydrolase family 24 [Brenneria nigrifluens DSM 30175 = ATCC 13028]QCR05145.1 lysozyme [Brenneria nigrifluens] [Brenneria nigrifluens DSM 30175 = ATCC 13028]
MSTRKSSAIVCAIGGIIALVLSMAPDMRSVNGNPLRFSKQALEIMANAEGCRRDPYLCPARIATQGIGHTGDGVGLDPVANDATIARWFAMDAMDAQNCIERNVENKLGFRLPQGVFDGIGSFIFNAGCSKFLTSTMYRYLLDTTYTAACDQLSRWVYGGGKKLPGLVDRRAKERALCLGR